jgi:hypothetical protein
MKTTLGGLASKLRGKRGSRSRINFIKGVCKRAGMERAMEKGVGRRNLFVMSPHP